MAVLYVHIGMPKTGTTAIQEFLFKNTEGLRKQKAVYPDFGLHYQWVPSSRNAYWLTTKGYEEETASRCFARINELADTYQTIILSDEVLWLRMGFQKSFWENMKTHLRDDLEIKLLAYIRRQDLYIHSWWAQNIKVQQPGEFKTYTLEEYLPDGTDPMNRLDYREYLRAGIEVLGTENIILRIFERGRFAGGSLYADFFAAIGLDLNDDFSVPENLTNISIKGTVLETKRYLNYLPEFSQKGFRLLPYLEKVQKKMESDGTLRERNDFPREQREKYLAGFAESNRWVAEELLHDPDGILFHEPIREDEGGETEYSTREITAVCGNIMIEMMKDLNRQKRKIADQQKTIKKQQQEIAQLKNRPDERQGETENGFGLKRKMRNLMKH